MLSYEGVGKSIEKAIEDALFNLKAPREDVDIKIIEEGGLFKKARVLVTISDDCREKYEEKKKKIEEEDVELDVKKLFSQKPVEEEVVQKSESTDVCEEVLSEDCCSEECCCQKECSNTSEQEVEEEKQAVERVKIDDINSVEFLKGLCQKLGISAEVECFKEDKKTIVCVKGENACDLIGYRGDCLNAVQYLLNVLEQRSENNTRVVLDIENYREKRENTLIALANRMARKVAKTRHQVKLEPMTPNERRIIHVALQNDAYVTTYSKGTEPNRYLIIAPKK